MSEQGGEPNPFRFHVTTHDPVALLVQMLLDIHAQLDVLSVLTIELHAKVFGQDAKETAERFEQLKADFRLEHAFRLQDTKPDVPEPPEEQA